MKVRNGRELTPRERDVLQDIWTGLSNKEIAASYGISHRTIQQHRQTMMRKWRVDNIATLLELGVARGVLKPHAFRQNPEAMNGGLTLGDGHQSMQQL